MEVDESDISLVASADSGHLSDLEAGLAHYRDLGFRLVEINPRDFHLIANGEIHTKPFQNFIAVLGNFDLRFTLHGINRLDLAFDPRLDIHPVLRQLEKIDHPNVALTLDIGHLMRMSSRD